jgi:hypothetical protein
MKRQFLVWRAHGGTSPILIGIMPFPAKYGLLHYHSLNERPNAGVGRMPRHLSEQGVFTSHLKSAVAPKQSSKLSNQSIDTVINPTSLRLKYLVFLLFQMAC